MVYMVSGIVEGVSGQDIVLNNNYIEKLELIEKIILEIKNKGD
jgi:hypothetical protein